MGEWIDDIEDDEVTTKHNVTWHGTLVVAKRDRQKLVTLGRASGGQFRGQILGVDRDTVTFHVEWGPCHGANRNDVYDKVSPVINIISLEMERRVHIEDKDQCRHYSHPRLKR